MPTLSAADSTLLIIDFQGRLMPAIEGGEAAVAQAQKLIAAALLLDVPILATEQNPKGLGGTVEGLLPAGVRIIEKMSFDASRAPELLPALDPARLVVVAGCEAHVCVLQTVIGLLDAGRRVALVADAVGSRREENRAAALARAERRGAEVVTTEMVIFEWLGRADHPKFRDALRFIR